MSKDKQFEIKEVQRVIAHRIVQKTEDAPCYPEVHESLYNLSAKDKEVLIQRIEKAVNNRKKCFDLSFKDKSDDSMFKHLTKLGFVSEDDEYINFSKEAAGKLSESQDNISIPGGYCLVADGKMKGGEYFICIIKADYQEVFNVRENSMHVLSDVFLSPAKDFYKVGFFMQDKVKNSFKPYMYDDQFSIYKDDLTLYFYDKFLGLSTDENNKLNTKNLYMDIIDFINVNVDFCDDNRGLIKAAQSYFRENTEGHVSVAGFSDRYLKNTKLETPFKKQYGEKYPRAIVLDTTLLTTERLMTQRTTLGDKITIITKEGVKMTLIDEENISKIIPTIKSGKNTKIVVFETTEEE
jgi:hypothetical protein